MDETSKTLRLLATDELALLKGKGIDIGCGVWPVRPEVQPFDQVDGDANYITRYVKPGAYDYVFSSHCLEHMRDPDHALGEWWQLVRPGGHLIVVVPDEDLYEQGYWPSLFNKDHKFTFTISKQQSWSPVSRNLLQMVRALPGAEIVSLRIQDEGYRRAFLAEGVWPQSLAWCVVRMRSLVVRVAPLRWLADSLCLLFRFPVDQLWGPAVAQILLVLEKRS
ncbi:MAG TPA: methyltransferase domain-containing protein [Gammaproteobacteria bacterium]|nr:methyltransferase domain-containing protein [Gammaproteobacteria bacterium]